MTTPTKSSRVVLGYQGNNKAVGEVKSNSYPIGQTQWKDLYATDGNKLLFERDSVETGTGSWINGSHRQSYAYQAGVNTGGEVSSPGGPDELELSTFPFNEPTAIAGRSTPRCSCRRPHRTPRCSCSCSTVGRMARSSI